MDNIPLGRFEIQRLQQRTKMQVTALSKSNRKLRKNKPQNWNERYSTDKRAGHATAVFHKVFCSV